MVLKTRMMRHSIVLASMPSCTGLRKHTVHTGRHVFLSYTLSPTKSPAERQVTASALSLGILLVLASSLELIVK